MTEIKQKFIGESKLIEAVRKKLTLRLGDKVVKPKHLSDEIVTDVIRPEVNDAVKEAIEHLPIDPGGGDTTTIIEVKSEKHNILHKNVEAYLKNTHYASNDASSSDIGKYQLNQVTEDTFNPFKITFATKRTGTLYIYDSPKKSSAVQTIPYNNTDTVEVINLFPGRVYWYKAVEDGKAIKEDTFELDGCRRFLTFPKAYNVRDFGGIPVSNGRMLNYGKIFRGSKLAQEDEATLRSLLGLRAVVIDLRRDSERDYVYSGTRFNFPITDFYGIPHLSGEQKTTLKNAISTVINYSGTSNGIYIHCARGAHRAGLLSAILQSLLGVPQCEIDKDYELTSFDKDYPGTASLQRTGTDWGYRQAYNYVINNYGSWKNFAIQELGISESNIEFFKLRMVTDYHKFDDLEPLYYETTYKNLKKLKDDKNLVPGATYRITDYLTRIANDGSYDYTGDNYNNGSYGVNHHRFDVIVKALSNDTLDAHARATQPNLKNNYFENDDLSKWELLYDIENDTSKYDWANPSNGKGVIYYMKDDRGNECPYDFKSIVFGSDNKYTFTSEDWVRDAGVKVWTGFGGNIYYGDFEVIFGGQNTEINLIFPPGYIDEEKYEQSSAYGYMHTGGLLEGIYYKYASAEEWQRADVSAGTYDVYFTKGLIDIPEYGEPIHIKIVFTNGDTTSLSFSGQLGNRLVHIENKNSHHNIIKPWHVNGAQKLNFNVFEGTSLIKENYLDYDCRMNTFYDKAIGNHFEAYCTDNTLNSCENVHLELSCTNNNICNSCNVTLGNECTNISLPNRITPINYKNLVFDSNIHDYTNGGSLIGSNGGTTHFKHPNSTEVVVELPNEEASNTTDNTTSDSTEVPTEQTEE